MNERNQSDISDPNFFLGKGHFSAQKEYDELLRLLLSDQKCEVQCKFPSRSKFISENLDLNLSFSHCLDLQGYLDESEGDSASMVLVSSFLGSPASYFGHTFIKLNKPNNLFFSHTIGFTADMPPSSSIDDLLYKTLMGDLEGKYIYAPYYQLLEQYNAIEQRTIIEYKLNLSKEEINNLRWHAYELHSIKTGYKVLSKNCAYELLWLLEVARPSLRLRENFKYYTVPSEIIDVLHKNNLIKHIITRPSNIDSMYNQYKSLNQNEKTFFSELKTSDDKLTMFNEADINSSSKQTLAYLLNTYYDVAFKKYGNPEDDFYEVKKIRYKNPKLDYKGETNSYLTPSKVSLGRISNDDGVGTQFSLRPVLFNRIDERNNELSEETLEIMSIKVNSQDNNIRVDSLDFLKIESLVRRYDFFAPPSWKFYMGANRSLKNNSLQPLLELASGLSYGSENSLIYCLVQPSIYPFEFSAGVSVVGGIGYWFRNTHIGLDLKENIAYSGQEPERETRTYVSIPFNNHLFFYATYDFSLPEGTTGLSYRF